MYSAIKINKILIDYSMICVENLKYSLGLFFLIVIYIGRE